MVNSHHFVFVHSYGISWEQDTLSKAQTFQRYVNENKTGLVNNKGQTTDLFCHEVQL